MDECAPNVTDMYVSPAECEATKCTDSTKRMPDPDCQHNDFQCDRGRERESGFVCHGRAQCLTIMEPAFHEMVSRCTHAVTRRKWRAYMKIL